MGQRSRFRGPESYSRVQSLRVSVFRFFWVWVQVSDIRVWGSRGRGVSGWRLPSPLDMAQQRYAVLKLIPQP